MRDAISRDHSESTSNFVNSIPLSDTSSMGRNKLGRTVNVVIDREVGNHNYVSHSPQTVCICYIDIVIVQL